MFQRKANSLLDPEHRLFFGDERLSLIGNLARVSDYNFREGSTLRWARASHCSFSFGKTLTGKTVHLEANSSETRRGIKLKIWDREGMSPQKQWLILNGA